MNAKFLRGADRFGENILLEAPWIQDGTAQHPCARLLKPILRFHSHVSSIPTLVPSCAGPTQEIVRCPTPILILSAGDNSVKGRGLARFGSE
jgi:hypothetical protein